MSHAFFPRLAAAVFLVSGLWCAGVPAHASMRSMKAMPALAMDANGAPDFNFTSEPVDTHVPGTDIYFAREYNAADVYRTDDGWYSLCEGKWYHADTWTGPWVGLERSLAPARLMNLQPAFAHYRHSMRTARRTALIHTTRVHGRRVSGAKY